MTSHTAVDRQGALAASSGGSVSRDNPFASVPRALTAQGHALLTNKFVAQLALVFLAYLIAGKLGQATTNLRSGNIGPVWPAFGIAVAGVLAYGPRIWPALAASAFLVALNSPVYALAAIGQAAGATVAALTGASMLRRIPGFSPSLVRLGDALAFIVIGAFGSAAISASVGLASLYAAGLAGYSGLGAAWIIYWLGDATGALLVTPLVFALPALVALRSRRLLELAALLVLLTAACLIIFGDVPVAPFQLRVMAFAVLPFVMWAAIKFGIGGASLSVFVIAAFATVLTALGIGPFSQDTPFVNAVLLDVLFSVLAISGLALAAVIAEREVAEAEHERLIRSQVAMETRLHLAAIVESSNDAVLSMTLDGTILSWNAAADRIFGFTKAEAIGQPVARLLPSWHGPEDGQGPQSLAEGVRIHPYEATGVTKNGEPLTLSVTVAWIWNADGTASGISTIVRDVTASKRAEEALSNLSRHLIEAQEQERRRIARELHDDISQRLAMLAINLVGSTELQQQVTGIAADVQALSHALHSSKVELLGITAAMRLFCSEFAEQQKCTVDFESQDLPNQLPSDLSLCLFRILQESLHNGLKHSGVQHFSVRLWGSPGEIHLTVTDRGKGFDVSAARRGRGIGLISMEERLKLVCGHLAIGSLPHRGTTIYARVPFVA